MAKASVVEDRWKRREAWRAIAGRIARISVSMYAKYGFSPESIASEYMRHWILYEGLYSTERGLVLPGDRDDEVLIL